MIDHAVARPLSNDRISPSSMPVIRRIGIWDLRASLAVGWDDFRAIPSQLFFLCIIYPVVALVFWKFTAGHGLLPLFYPLASGFALIGPLAAIGLYEISMRRERGLPASWLNCFDVLRSPGLGSVVALALALVAIFVLWIAVAQTLFHAAFGDVRFSQMSDFLDALFSTRRGWFLILAGNLVGLAFACIVLAISVVAFPMMLDRNADVALAVRTSLQAVARNPMILGLWGLAVAALVVLGSLLAFVGLAVVLPVLGHATWHLYRRLIAS
jgi:uncharacterized membrane protein